MGIGCVSASLILPTTYMKSMMFYRMSTNMIVTRVLPSTLRLAVMPLRHYVNRTSINGPNNEEVHKISNDSNYNTEDKKINDFIYKHNIKMFTVEAGAFADRLYSRQHQLQCVGGNALKNTEVHPQCMIFVNIGVDDKGVVNWSHMTPQLNNSVIMDNVIVTFEAVDGSGGIRPGSAVVRYHLQFKSHTCHTSAIRDNDENIAIVLGIIIMFSAAFLWYTIINDQPRSYEQHKKLMKKYPYTTERAYDSSRVQRDEPSIPRYPYTSYPEQQPHTIVINTTTERASEYDWTHVKNRQSQPTTETYLSNQSSPVIGVAKTGDDE